MIYDSPKIDKSYKPTPPPIDWSAPPLQTTAQAQTASQALTKYLQSQFNTQIQNAVTELSSNCNANSIESIKSCQYKINAQSSNIPTKLYERMHEILAKYEKNEGKNDEELKKENNKTTNDIEIKDFLMKLELDKKERHRFIQEITKKEEQKYKQELLEQEQKAKQKKEEETQTRKSQIQNRMKQIEERAEKRKKSVQERKLDRLVKQKYLYKELEEEYKLKETNEKQEAYESAKVQLKNMYKPINKNELETHSKKIDSLIKAHEEETAKLNKSKKEEEAQRIRAINKMQTRMSQKVIQSLDKERNNYIETKNEKKELKNKMRAYAHVVKETIVPNISENKVNQRLQAIDSLHTKKREGKQINELPDYLHMFKPGVNRSVKNIESDSNTIAFPSIYKDYLKDQREKRSAADSYKKAYNWESILQNEEKSQLQKYKEVIDTVSMLETKAERGEKLFRLQNRKDIGKSEKASNMFIDAIKAKLALLDEM